MLTAPIYAHVTSLSTTAPDVCTGPDPAPAVDPDPATDVAKYALPPLTTESPTDIPDWLIAQLLLPCDALSCIFCTSSAT